MSSKLCDWKALRLLCGLIMAASTVQRNAGLTVALSVTSTAHAAVLIDDNTNDQINYTFFLNLGASPIAIRMGPTDPGAPVFQRMAQTEIFVLPPLMTSAMILASPTTPYYITAKSNSAVAGVLYVTPAADQS
jgi:hypothetical protein